MSSVLLPVHNKQGLVSHLSTQDNNRSSVRPIHTGQFPYYVKLSVPSVHNRQCQVFHNRQCQVFHLSKLDMVWCPTCVQRTMPNVHTRQCQVSQLSKTENVKCSTCPHWTRYGVQPVCTRQNKSVPPVHNRQCQVSTLDKVWCLTCLDRTMSNVHLSTLCKVTESVVHRLVPHSDFLCQQFEFQFVMDIFP